MNRIRIWDHSLLLFLYVPHSMSMSAVDVIVIDSTGCVLSYVRVRVCPFLFCQLPQATPCLLAGPIFAVLYYFPFCFYQDFKSTRYVAKVMVNKGVCEAIP